MLAGAFKVSVATKIGLLVQRCGGGRVLGSEELS